jgi:hypothetical protein
MDQSLSMSARREMSNDNAHVEQKNVVVVGCHRVLGKGGKLTGYAGGVARAPTSPSHDEDLPI